MKIKAILFFFMLLQVYHLDAQSDSLPIHLVPVANTSFKSFQIIGNNLFAICSDGKAMIYEADTGLPDNEIGRHPNADGVIVLDDNYYTAVGKDKKGQIYLGTKKGKVYTLNPDDLSRRLVHDGKYYVYEICIGANNELFLIVPYALWHPKTNKFWTAFNHAQSNGVTVKRKYLGLFQRPTKRYFHLPQRTFVDNKGLIWMTNSYGEFGGQITVFDTKSRSQIKSKFENINMGLFFPKSVFEDTLGNIYATSGLQHFGSSGSIVQVKIDGISSTLFESHVNPDSIFDGSSLFIGPGAYNKHDGHIYFASSYGFFKTRMGIDGKLLRPEFLFEPSLTWHRERLAIGFEMSVLKIDFTEDNRLVFLTANDGIGIYDGQKLTFLK